MKHLSLSALAAVGVLAGMTAANAADLGGNCCADLEERIAELEATTARKGNRKVSLTISGWIGQQLSVWDDGTRTKAYVSDLGATLSTNVKFTGQAQINSDWSAGYVLHLETYSNDPLLHTNNNVTQGSGLAVGDPGSVGVLQSFWFLKSNTLGKLSIGKQSSAADNAAILPDGSGSLVAANYVLFDNNAMFLRKNGLLLNDSNFGGTWGSLATCPGIQAGVSADCDGVPNNNIRYDTPVFGGFSASASWGESDIWALAGRYAGEHAGNKVSLAIAYTESSNTLANPGSLNPGIPSGNFRVHGGALQIGAYVENIPTGLFVYGAYGKDFNTSMPSQFNPPVAFPTSSKPDGDNFYIKAGIRQKWTPLGHTVLFGEYGENNDKQSIALWQAGATSANVSQWGLGVVQEIDAAAMSLWFVYRDYSADMTCGQASFFGSACNQQNPTPVHVNFQDFQVFKMGGLINF